MAGEHTPADDLKLLHRLERGEITSEQGDVLSATASDLLGIIEDLLQHSIAHYGNPVDETHGVGLVHAKARAAISGARSREARHG